MKNYLRFITFFVFIALCVIGIRLEKIFSHIVSLTGK